MVSSRLTTFAARAQPIEKLANPCQVYALHRALRAAVLVAARVVAHHLEPLGLRHLVAAEVERPSEGDDVLHLLRLASGLVARRAHLEHARLDQDQLHAGARLDPGGGQRRGALGRAAEQGDRGHADQPAAGARPRRARRRSRARCDAHSASASAPRSSPSHQSPHLSRMRALWASDSPGAMLKVCQSSPAKWRASWTIWPVW